MPSLIDIKKKIKATKNTRKITKAMQLVSASKMRGFQKKAVHSRTYVWDLLEVLRENMKESLDSPLTEQRTTGKTLFVLYTSDKGLCGALNGRILKTLVQSDLWKKTPEKDRLLMTIGKKSYDFARYRNIPVAKSFQSVNEKMTLLDSLEIVDEIIKYWEHHKVKQVVMVAPHYKNSLVYYPVMKTYLPFSREMVKQHVNAEEMAEGKKVKEEVFEHEPPIIFEPSKARFSGVLVEQLVYTLFMQAFFELKAAEYSSRMIAMQNATDSAGDIINKQTLKFNKLRQAAITQEIAEIVGGAMA